MAVKDVWLPSKSKMNLSLTFMLQLTTLALVACDCKGFNIWPKAWVNIILAWPKRIPAFVRHLLRWWLFVFSNNCWLHSWVSSWNLEFVRVVITRTWPSVTDLKYRLRIEMWPVTFDEIDFPDAYREGQSFITEFRVFLQSEFIKIRWLLELLLASFWWLSGFGLIKAWVQATALEVSLGGNSFVSSLVSLLARWNPVWLCFRRLGIHWW